MYLELSITTIAIHTRISGISSVFEEVFVNTSYEHMCRIYTRTSLLRLSHVSIRDIVLKRNIATHKGVILYFIFIIIFDDEGSSLELIFLH